MAQLNDMRRHRFFELNAVLLELLHQSGDLGRHLHALAVVGQRAEHFLTLNHLVEQREVARQISIRH